MFSSLKVKKNISHRSLIKKKKKQRHYIKIFHKKISIRKYFGLLQTKYNKKIYRLTKFRLYLYIYILNEIDS